MFVATVQKKHCLFSSGRVTVSILGSLYGRLHHANICSVAEMYRANNGKQMLLGLLCCKHHVTCGDLWIR